MGWKKWVLGAAAVKAARVLTRPNILAPEGYKITGMKHQGLIGSSWKVSYIIDEQPGLHKNFTIRKGTTSRTGDRFGDGNWKFYWN